MTLHVRVPTNRTVEGPEITMAKGRLVIDYDFENDNGSIQQGRLVFEEVLAFEYFEGSCSPPESVLGSTEVRALDESEYLDRVRSGWDEAFGWQDWQLKLGGVNRFKHFTVYFDDAASFNIVASSCRIEP